MNQSSQSVYAGGCVCGAVRYECQAAPVLAAHCHCRDCQRSSGAPMSTVIGVPTQAFRAVKGKPKSHRYQGDSGKDVHRYFCGECGAPLYTEVAVMPDVRFIRAVSLDDASWVKPSMHIYCVSAQPWDNFSDGLPRFEKMPT